MNGSSGKLSARCQEVDLIPVKVSDAEGINLSRSKCSVNRECGYRIPIWVGTEKEMNKNHCEHPNLLHVNQKYQVEMEREQRKEGRDAGVAFGFLLFCGPPHCLVVGSVGIIMTPPR